MSDAIVTALTQPASVAAFSPAEWDVLIRQARRANLLSRLAAGIEDFQRANGPINVLKQASHHLFSALAMAERQELAIRWEVKCIQTALAGTGVSVVLLKGAAYVMAGLPAARGRLFSDVDIIVPKSAIGDTEAALMQHGWNTGQHSAYDDRYYRQWMHEIPPMQHIRRGTVIDVHHSILPETARFKTYPAKMLAAIVPAQEGVFVLAPTDMVLHSATHLFHEGELDNGLRDLFDLDSLLRHFGAQDGFWQALVPRAQELGLIRPLYYALRYTRKMLGTLMPAQVVQASEIGRPPAAIRALMDFCYARALRPMHASCTDALTPLARHLLYLRSHWIRMPMGLLIVHLLRKALVKPEVEDPEGPTALAVRAQQEKQ